MFIFPSGPGGWLYLMVILLWCCEFDSAGIMFITKPILNIYSSKLLDFINLIFSFQETLGIFSGI